MKRDGDFKDLIKVCAWCGEIEGPNVELAENSQISHGICDACLDHVSADKDVQLLKISDSQLDEIPFGIIELDENGVVARYNKREEEIAATSREDVVGKNFFDEVAPCTSVKEFRGQFEQLITGDVSAVKRFGFLFRFPHNHLHVNIAIAFDNASRLTTIIVKEKDFADTFKAS